MHRLLLLAALFVSPAMAQYRTQALTVSSSVDTAAHIADGEGWSTEIVLVNVDDKPVGYAIDFFQDNGTALQVPFQNLGMQSRLTGSLPLLGTVTYKTVGTSFPVVQGWARLDMNGYVGGMVIFKRSQAGLPNFEGVVPFDRAFSNRQVLPFDHTGGIVTGLALVNPSNFSTYTATLNFRDQNGVVFHSAEITLGPRNHKAFVVPVEYPQTANRTGLLEIIVPGFGSFGALGLRTATTGPFTTIFPLEGLTW